MNKVHIQKWLIGISIFGLIGIFTFIITQPYFAFAHNETEINENINNNQSEKAKMNHENIVFLTEQFMDMILQDIDEDYKVTQFESKDDLINRFKTIATIEVAQPYVDFYFEETEEGLYIVPTETPPWFNPENDYDMIQSGNKTIITQENESDLYGEYTIKFEFTYHEDEWLITDIDYS